MKRIVTKMISILVFCLSLLSTTHSVAQCYKQLIDASGITLENTDVKALKDSACALRDVFPKALQDSFSVIDLGFYALTDDTEGGIAEFTRMAEDVLRESPSTKYYLLFGRQTDSKNGPNSKVFVKVKLPTWGNFKCMTDMERFVLQYLLEQESVKVEITRMDDYVKIECATMSTLRNKIFKIVDCCYRSRDLTCDMEELNAIPCFNKPIDERYNGINITICEPLLETTPTNGKYVGGSPGRDKDGDEDLKFGDDGAGDLDLNGLDKDPFDSNLFGKMDFLLGKIGTFCNHHLTNVTSDYIKHFRYGNGEMYFSPTLSLYVSKSPELRNYIKDFGIKWAGNINKESKLSNLEPFTFKEDETRPTFGGTYNQQNGLTILINDTEKTDIWATNFVIDPVTLVWKADLYVEIRDNFGLDKADIVKYGKTCCGAGNGFISWWILQHQRSYKPFVTLIKIKATIQGQYKPKA